MKKPIKISITGAAGNIGYALVFRIAAGEMFGPDQPVILNFIEIRPEPIKAVMLELEDCAFPALYDMNDFIDPKAGFKDAEYALLIGARPRKEGMERKDLIKINSDIFKIQGQALNENASPDVRITVIGNPANTNTLIAMNNAPDIPPAQFSSLIRLDHTRAVSMLAQKLQCPIPDIKKVAIWGNHSTTQFPDIQHCEVAGKPVREKINQQWWHDTFVPTIQNRGAYVIKARGMSSAASAANSILQHVKYWRMGTPDGDWTSMGVVSDGSYGIKPGLIFSYPVTTADNEWKIVPDLSLDDYEIAMIKKTELELCQEFDQVSSLLK